VGSAVGKGAVESSEEGLAVFGAEEDKTVGRGVGVEMETGVD
jgi:hypothetical protein